jgi:hypothetical protein
VHIDGVTVRIGIDKMRTARAAPRLDGLYRRSPPAPYGINAARGRWTSEHTFVMERRILGTAKPRRGR